SAGHLPQRLPARGGRRDQLPGIGTTAAPATTASVPSVGARRAAGDDEEHGSEPTPDSGLAGLVHGSRADGAATCDDVAAAGGAPLKAARRPRHPAISVAGR